MSKKEIRKRFDGFLPIVLDVETGGANPLKDALLEVAAVSVNYNNENVLVPNEEIYRSHVIPFEGSHLDPDAMSVNRIQVDHPFRFAQPEIKVLQDLFTYVNKALNDTRCRRAILVGHNAHFDLGFIQAAVKRCKLENTPFHRFTVFDTATLGGLMYKKTVLAKILKEANIEFDKDEAHSAVYDTIKTAELFCKIINTVDATPLDTRRDR